MSSNGENVLNASPLITVSGHLSEFILNGSLSSQITSDLGRESIQWHCSYDAPVPVYLEANLIALDEEKHFLVKHISRCEIVKNGHTSKNILIQNNTVNNNSQSLRRHHSFNIQRHLPRNQEFVNKAIESVSGGDLNCNDDGTNEQVNTKLFKLIGLRYILTNSGRVLTNSYWLDACNDLETYNQLVREDLMDWFNKILTLTAYYNRIGLINDFLLEFCIIVVVRNITASATSVEHSTKKKNAEQVLSLDKLIESNDGRGVFKNGTNILANKFTKNSSFTNASVVQTQHNTLNTTLSSSLTSLTSTNSQPNSSTTHLSYVQLVDHIRNDLLVCFQLFQQNNFQHGNFDSNIPAHSAQIASQLLERIIIFDSTSNASHSNIINSGTSTISGNGSNNPLISSTAKTFSALSNFSSGSIKISSSSMMSPSKSSFSGKSFKSSSSSQVIIQNYSSFVNRFRTLLLDSYSRQFDSYERTIRRQRELRNKSDWDFFGFFLLQEELAFVYENLGLYNKALIQYDELDALFSQSILNTSNVGIAPLWLHKRIICDARVSNVKSEKTSVYSAWNGLCLCNPDAISLLRQKIVYCVHNTTLTMDNDDDDDTNINDNNDNEMDIVPSDSDPKATSLYKRDASVDFDDPLGVVKHPRNRKAKQDTVDGHISLIDFRNYLFARQCHLLCLLNKPWDLASRALPFLQTCVTELNLLEIPIAPGGVACWVFLSVLEILHKCERYSDSSQLESYSYHTVGLWSYARNNLAELGKICNLMPGLSGSRFDSSEHLHRMVELVAGMGTDPHVRVNQLSDNEIWLSPQERLKDSLSSTEAFLKHYLEITELTMGTYKHIGYIRSARLIGKELSELYLMLQKPQQALPFLLDFYNIFQLESWTSLKLEASRLLAQCLEQLYYSAFSSQPETMMFNLEATVRGAFRTYLLLFLYHVQIDSCQTMVANKTPCKSSSHYFNSMVKLLEHYNQNGVKLEEINTRCNKNSSHISSPMLKLPLNSPLLAIHNCYSDLFHEPPPSGSNSTVSSSNSNLNSSTSSKLASSDLNISSIFASNLENHLTPIHYFIKVSDIKITSESNMNHCNLAQLSSNLKNQSFIAGSLLSLKLEIFSYFVFDLNIDNLFVTLDCNHFARCDSQKDLNENFEKSDRNSSYDHHSDYQNKFAVIEAKNSGNNYGLACLNSTQLLKRQFQNGGHKFMLQLPVSLLNQRLSEDPNSLKHYKFVTAPYQFESLNNSSQLQLKPGKNIFNLKFHSPEQFKHLENNLNTDSVQTNAETNQLFFNLDQLVILCKFPTGNKLFDQQLPESNTANLSFAIVDDFSSDGFDVDTFFRLVKCPPVIELTPKANYSSNVKSYLPYLIGIDHPVVLSINSGTNLLPKGMKCFVKISPFMANIGDGSIDYRSVNVTLNKVNDELSNSSKNDSLLYFNLDRQLNPFETYELDLIIKSNYCKPQIRVITSKNSSITKANMSQQLVNNQRDFQLTISWSHLETNSYNTVNANCRFTLYDPFSMQTYFHTSMEKKFLQIILRGAEQLTDKYSLQFSFPQISFDNNNCYFSSVCDSSPSIICKPLSFIEDSVDSSEQFTYELFPKQELNFVWEILDAKHASLRQFTLNFTYRSFDLANMLQSLDIIKSSYEMRVQFSYGLIYLIRQSIEPLPGAKNSELFRIGNSCMFKVRIEKVSTENSDDDEHLLYELVCDSELWSLVSNKSLCTTDSCESSLVSTEDGSDEHRSIDTVSSKSSSQSSTSQSSNPSSNVIKLSEKMPIFETAFEVTPLISGYIPMPYIRVYRYLLTTSNTPSKTNGNSPGVSRNNKIESLSAKLSENLSITSKNITKMMNHLGNKSGSDGHNIQRQLHANLMPFEQGQVFNNDRASQIYVLPSNSAVIDT